MPFFEDLAAIMGDRKNVSLTFRKTGERLTAMVEFSTEHETFAPMTFSGAPKEFDQQFIARIRKAGKALNGFHDNLGAFKKALIGKERKARKRMKKDAGRVEIKSTPAAKSNDRASQPSLMS
jgi:PRTRC genetic system protein E